MSGRLRRSPDEEWQVRYLALKDWLPMLRSVPSYYYSRISTVLPNIQSRIEDLIALEAVSSDESESGPIKVQRPLPPLTDIAPVTTGPDREEVLLLNDPPVSFKFYSFLSPVLIILHSAIFATKQTGTASDENQLPMALGVRSVMTRRSDARGSPRGAQ